MLHVPSDDNNIHQMEPHSSIAPSPENSPSSSPASLSSSTISSLTTWRSASEQLPTPIFSFPDPPFHLIGTISAITTGGPSMQHISSVHTSSLNAPSFQESIIPSIDEDDLRWTAGVPCHMLDVFRANPFTLTDLPRTSLPSLHNSVNPHNAECKVRSSRSAAKHGRSPDAVEQKKKSRAKRARIHLSPVVPFPATGPQEMFAYEFRLDAQCGSNDLSHADNYGRGGDMPPSYSLSRTIDDRGHLSVPRPVVASSAEATPLCFPAEYKDMDLSPPPCLPYPYPRIASIPEKRMLERRTQPSPHPLFPSMLFSTHLSSRRGELSNPAALLRQGVDEYLPKLEFELECNSLPIAVPMQAASERVQICRVSAAPTASSIQKPLYACPLCPRDFQLPNGLALHLKWHDRVGSLTKKQISYPSRRPQHRVTQIFCDESSPPNARDVRANRSPVRDHSQRGAITRLPSTSYTATQVHKSARAESMESSSHGQQAMSSISYERQPQECALFHDALQSNRHLSLSLDNNVYLAPLDGLSVLQPLPFEQYQSSCSQLCIVPPQ
ncbi:hypothetical protein F5148DRAFT_606241 [Russula earlei]|uniref:Uncharacterized protein n=1 Tax=Russula earlei TaxID=71964 RepID=A0ACC0UGX5_9AGAM|nr:hypothetical protein F5148DRAFT_606241 [Russula earlei]